MELVGSSVRKWFLGDRCVNCSYVSLHREDNLLRRQGAIWPASDWASPPSPGSRGPVSVGRLAAAVLVSRLGQALGTTGTRGAELAVPFAGSLSCFPAAGSTYPAVSPTITDPRLKGGSPEVSHAN